MCRCFIVLLIGLHIYFIQPALGVNNTSPGNLAAVFAMRSAQQQVCVETPQCSPFLCNGVSCPVVPLAECITDTCTCKPLFFLVQHSSNSESKYVNVTSLCNNQSLMSALIRNETLTERALVQHGQWFDLQYSQLSAEEQTLLQAVSDNSTAAIPRKVNQTSFLGPRQPDAEISPVKLESSKADNITKTPSVSISAPVIFQSNDNAVEINVKTKQNISASIIVGNMSYIQQNSSNSPPDNHDLSKGVFNGSTGMLPDSPGHNDEFGGEFFVPSDEELVADLPLESNRNASAASKPHNVNSILNNGSVNKETTINSTISGTSANRTNTSVEAAQQNVAVTAAETAVKSITTTVPLPIIPIPLTGISPFPLSPFSGRTRQPIMLLPGGKGFPFGQNMAWMTPPSYGEKGFPMMPFAFVPQFGPRLGPVMNSPFGPFFAGIARADVPADKVSNDDAKQGNPLYGYQDAPNDLSPLNNADKTIAFVGADQTPTSGAAAKLIGSHGKKENSTLVSESSGQLISEKLIDVTDTDETAGVDISGIAEEPGSKTSSQKTQLPRKQIITHDTAAKVAGTLPSECHDNCMMTTNQEICRLVCAAKSNNGNQGSYGNFVTWNKVF